MKTITEQDRHLCALQGKIFAASLGHCALGSAVFVRRFMLSDAAARLDTCGLDGGPLEPGQLVCEVGDRCSASSYGTVRFTAEELYWMGYLYRYWCCLTGQSSKAVYHIIGARELRELYYPYHSLDVEQAIERIREAKGVAVDKTSIEYGVVALRRIRAQQKHGRPRD
jgi:hypothetical protein